MTIIKMIRENKGKTQVDLVRDTGLSLGTIKKADEDMESISLRNIRLIAKALGVGIGEVVMEVTSGV